jgi:hypothetical protein
MKLTQKDRIRGQGRIWVHPMKFIHLLWFGYALNMSPNFHVLNLVLSVAMLRGGGTFKRMHLTGGHCGVLLLGGTDVILLGPWLVLWRGLL